MYSVYILANKKNGTLYIGFTSELKRRMWEHKNKAVKGFTEKYGVDKLVFFETTERKEAALVKEKQLKKWNRAWKLELIKKFNPQWLDLYPNI